MNQLEVGDKITESKYGQKTILEVTRVTEKRAFAKKGIRYEIQFYRQFGEWLKPIGLGSYSPHYTVATQSDFDEIELSKLREDCRKLNCSKLTANQCRRILQIANDQ